MYENSFDSKSIPCNNLTNTIEYVFLGILEELITPRLFIIISGFIGVIDQ